MYSAVVTAVVALAVVHSVSCSLATSLVLGDLTHGRLSSEALGCVSGHPVPLHVSASFETASSECSLVTVRSVSGVTVVSYAVSAACALLCVVVGRAVGGSPVAVLASTSLSVLN